ncbi:MAG: hypothetical protein KC653_01770 [Candidatus Andersenbacteria bacterium]|nr:hypothetical protein [Candidatus Andersenbacteria bacterium]
MTRLGHPIVDVMWNPDGPQTTPVGPTDVIIVLDFGVRMYRDAISAYTWAIQYVIDRMARGCVILMDATEKAEEARSMRLAGARNAAMNGHRGLPRLPAMPGIANVPRVTVSRMTPANMAAVWGETHVFDPDTGGIDAALACIQSLTV